MRKNQILDEAFKLFARQGYGPTTMQQIGDAVGLDKSSLYVHFKNKSEIFSVILATELGSYNQSVIEDTLKSGSFKEISHSVILNTLRYFRDKDKLLFWKHVMLMTRNCAYPEIAEQVSCVMTQLNGNFAEKLRQTMTHTDNPVRKRKQGICLFILAQGLLDWLTVQENPTDADIKIVLEVCDNIFETSQLFNE